MLGSLAVNPLHASLLAANLHALATPPKAVALLARQNGPSGVYAKPESKATAGGNTLIVVADRFALRRRRRVLDFEAAEIRLDERLQQ
jgi:hypothetical protein